VGLAPFDFFDQRKHNISRKIEYGYGIQKAAIINVSLKK
jgi:hypothetical protein